MLTQDRIDRYRETGYLLLERALPPRNLAEVRAATEELMAPAARLVASNDVLELEDSHTAEAPRVRRIKNAARQHPTYAALVRSESVLAPVRDLIGQDVRLLGAKVNIKGAGGGAAIEWHQDWAFYPHTNEDLLAVGIFLDDVDAQNAPLLVLPGSHRGPIYDHHSNGVFVGGVDPVAQGIDASRAVMVTGPAGSLSIHHVRLLHGSAINRSGRPRRMMFIELAAADAWPLRGVPSFAEWFESSIVSGSPTMSWRMERLPVRVPYPDAYPGASSADATIYKAQAHLPRRYFGG